MKKKILITLIAVCTILVAFGIINVSAETEGIYTYSVSSGAARITDCDDSASGEIVIPSTLGGYPVTSISHNVFRDCINLTSVTIPDGVTSIGSAAFYGCSNLVRVAIPDSITEISNYAFSGCALERVDISDISAWCKIKFYVGMGDFSANPLSLANDLYLNGNLVTNLIIPDGVTSIGDYAFYKCSCIVSVSIPNSVTTIGKSAFSDCSGLTRVDISDISAWCNISFGGAYSSNPLYYAHNLYLNGELVTNLTIPDSVTSIGSYAFENCSSLESITIPDSVTSIGKGAFEYCSSLVSITIPDNVTSIGEGAFGYCSSLVSITIPDSVTSIGNYAFRNCGNIVSITIPDSVKTMGYSVFYNCSSLANITILDGVTTIGDSAFSNCDNLVSVTIPDSVTTIGNEAFYDCSSLANVIIPDGVTTIGDYAFSYCGNLVSVAIGTSLETIPESAFSNCDNLKCVALTAKIKYIRNDAFNSCSNIKTVFYSGDESQWNEILFYNNENITNAKVVYNATKKTYKFETNSDAKLDDITDYAIFTIPTVQNGGMTLSGWYDNATLTGDPVTFPYYGDATTLYAAWTDRTGKSFDDAFIAKANQEYTITTTESGQLVYFEFIPNLSKEYRFYTTGNLDTYGYLYNSNKSQLTSNDDAGEGNNFYISYNLTAGETYYIATKLYSGTGTFTFVVEEPVDYRINEITIKDMSGNSLQAIPTGTFLATVSFTNVSSSADTVIILAQYTEAGSFKGLMYIQTEDVPTGSTIKLSIPVDNSSGDVAKLKAFCWESFVSLTPMGNSASFPAE